VSSQIPLSLKEMITNKKDIKLAVSIVVSMQRGTISRNTRCLRLLLLKQVSESRYKTEVTAVENFVFEPFLTVDLGEDWWEGW